MFVIAESPGALALVGPGRAGSAVALALSRIGWRVSAVAGRGPGHAPTATLAARLGARAATGPADASAGASLVVVAVPDAAIGEVAEALAVAPDLSPGTLVVHLAGSFGTGVLAPIAARRPDVRLGALHPLQTLPDADLGASRLDGAWWAVAGDPATGDLARALGGRPFTVADADRARYHAAACVTGNHLVALMGQVERIVAGTGIPAEAFLPLAHAAIDNVGAIGARAALTGPVARGDAATVARHLEAIPESERAAYRALAAAALTLTGRADPVLEAVTA